MCAFLGPMVIAFALGTFTIELDQQVDRPVTAAIWTPNADGVVLGSQGRVEHRDWPDIERTTEIPTTLRYVHALSFSPDGQFLAIAGGSPAEYGQIEIWNWSERRKCAEANLHDDVVYDVCFHSKGDLVVTSSGDGTCRVLAWSLGPMPTFREVGRFEAHSRGVLSSVFVDEDLIATSGLDATIRIWNCRTQSEQRSFDQHLAPVGQLFLFAPPKDPRQPPTLSPDAMLVSASFDRTVRFWNPLVGRMIRFARVPSSPTAMRWSAREQSVIVGCRDGSVRWIDPATAKEIATVVTKSSRITDLMVHPRSNEILIIGDGVDLYKLPR